MRMFIQSQLLARDRLSVAYQQQIKQGNKATGIKYLQVL